MLTCIARYIRCRQHPPPKLNHLPISRSPRRLWRYSRSVRTVPSRDLEQRHYKECSGRGLHGGGAVYGKKGADPGGNPAEVNEGRIRARCRLVAAAHVELLNSTQVHKGRVRYLSAARHTERVDPAQV